MNIETAVKLAKPFVGSLRSAGNRPVLKTALVNEEYVIATDAHTLIRIKHDEVVTEPYLHKYKDFDELFGIEVTNFPQTDRIIPDPAYAKDTGQLDTKELVKAIECACVAAEMNSKIDYAIMLEENKHVAKELKRSKDDLKKISKNHVRITADKLTVKPNKEDFQTGEFTYTFDKALPISEETAFNPEYLKTVFKTFKAAKEQTIDSYYISKLRPWLLVSGPIEVVILPVRTW